MSPFVRTPPIAGKPHSPTSQPAAFLKSPGIGHETKSKIELGVAGKDGFFDDLKVWNAEPAKP